MTQVPSLGIEVWKECLTCVSVLMAEWLAVTNEKTILRKVKTQNGEMKYTGSLNLKELS